MSSAELVPWQANSPVRLPKDADQPAQVAPLARQLRSSDIDKVVRAFEAGLFELAVEYVWTRTMSVLKRQLASMGMGFVGELLARPDINENSAVEQAVTDYDAIQIAQQLGIVNRRGAMELRQASETLSYFVNPDADDDHEMTKPQAMYILQACVANILARDVIEPAIDFIAFRRKLTQSILPEDDPDLTGIKAAPYFFKRTTVRVLLADARGGKGAQAENALGNLGSILERIWDDLLDPDRWQVGQAYAEANANNLRLVSVALRRILLRLQGFDYVPETLRSSTYTRAANDVLIAHQEMNNFYNEPAPMKTLASLGSTIPGPAFQICMRAALAVKLGNGYGRSYEAQEHADQLLSTLTRDRWQIYLDKYLPVDEMILTKLTLDRPAENWLELVRKYQLSGDLVMNPSVASLLKGPRSSDVQRRAEVLIKQSGVS
jgi:hypothetical protein